MTRWQQRMVMVAARIAFAARGIMLGAGGYFIARAALDRMPREARGPAGALHSVWELPYGSVWLAAVATGLICTRRVCPVPGQVAPTLCAIGVSRRRAWS